MGSICQDYDLVKGMLDSASIDRAIRAAFVKASEATPLEMSQFLPAGWKEKIALDALLDGKWKNAGTTKDAFDVLSHNLKARHDFVMSHVRKSGPFERFESKLLEKAAVYFGERLETFGCEGIMAKRTFEIHSPCEWAEAFRTMFPYLTSFPILPEFEPRDYLDLPVACDIELCPLPRDARRGAGSCDRALPPDSSKRLAGLLGAWTMGNGLIPDSASSVAWLDAVLASSSAVWACEQFGHGVDELVDGYVSAIGLAPGLAAETDPIPASLGADLHECANDTCRFTVCSSLTVLEVVTMVVEKKACWEFSPAFANPAAYACGMHDAEFGQGRLGVEIDGPAGPLRFTGENVRAVHFEGTPSLKPAYLTAYQTKDIYQPNLRRSSETFEATPVKAKASDLLARLAAGLGREQEGKQPLFEAETPCLEPNFRPPEQPESRPVLENGKTTNIKLDLPGRRKTTNIKLVPGKGNRPDAER